MPNCFNLVKKGETEPSLLHKVDEEICEHLGVEVHEIYWCEGWYDIIGFQIAMGKKLGSEELRNVVAKYSNSEQLLKILSFLEERYESNAWYSVR